MAQIETRDFTPAFASEVRGFDPGMLGDPAVREQLQAAFDARGVLVFRDLDITHAEQVELCETLIQRPGASATNPVGDNWYISNERPQSAAPFGRLQFHSDTMWAHQPCEIVSLYAVKVEPPVVPTTFVSTIQAWATLPDDLRAQVDDRSALHTAGEVRRGDLEDVLVTTVERAPWTVKPIGLPHPRTATRMLYSCEQMTKEVVGMDADDSEALLEALFAHMYDPAMRWHHEWRTRDLVAWDNLAVQHARPNVDTDGPARTLRKVATPMPSLDQEEMPAYSTTA